MADIFPETVENPRYAYHYFTQGNRRERFLYVELDGRDVAIHQEQRLLEKYSVVTLMPVPGERDYESPSRYKATLPAEEWRPASEFEAATSDPRVVALTRRFISDLQTGRWSPGPVESLRSLDVEIKCNIDLFVELPEDTDVEAFFDGLIDRVNAYTERRGGKMVGNYHLEFDNNGEDEEED